MKQPYLHVRVVGQHVEVRGTPSCTVGHPLEHCTEHGREGVFVEWHWDGKRLTVRNDRYGFHPCFYFQNNDEICVSPSILRLLEEGAPTDLDCPGLAVFLHLGYFIGEDTPFKRIRALPPRARLEWEKGRFSLSGGLTTAKPQRLSRDEAMDAYIDLFEASIRRRLPPSTNFAVPLSAGKDSRHILLALCKMGHKPRFCITMKRFAPNPNQDARIAPRLARALEVNTVILEQPTSEFSIELRKNVLTDFCSDEHQWVLAMADFLTGRVEAIYEGVAGDFLSSGNAVNARRLALYQSGRFVQLARDVLKAHGWSNIDPDIALERLLGRCESRKFGRDAAIAHLAPELARHADAANPVTSFLFWNIDRREMALAPYAILGDIARVFCPYLDHALFDFLIGLPAGLVMDGRFHADTIRRGYPRHAHIPFQNKAAPAPSTWPRDVKFARDMAAYLLRRKPSRWIRKRFLAPRMLGSVLSSRYAASTAWFARMAVYLLHLESVANGTAWPLPDPASSGRQDAGAAAVPDLKARAPDQ